MPKALLLIVVLFFSLASSVNASNASAYTNLSQMIERVLQVSPGIKVFEQQSIQAGASLESLEAMLNPQFIFNGEHRREKGMGIWSNISIDLPDDFPIDIPGLPEDGVSSSSMASLTIVQQLGANNQLRAGLDKANIGKTISEIQYEQAVKTAIVDATNSYIALLKAYLGLTLARLSYQHNIQELGIIKQKQEQGSATALDVLRQQNEVSESENQVAQAKTGFRLALLHQSQLLSEEVPSDEKAEKWVSDLLEQEKKITLWEISLDEALEYGMKNRLEIKLLDQQLAIAQVNVDEVKDARNWTISLDGMYSEDDWIFQGSVDSDRALRGTTVRNFTEEDSISLNTDNNANNPWQVTLGVNWRFGDGGAGAAEEKRLKAVLLESEYQYQEAIDGLYLEINSLWEQHRQAWSSYQLNTQRLKEAEKTYEQLIALYELGSLTELELLEGQLLLSQSNNALRSAKWDYQISSLDLAVALGMPTTEVVDLVGGN